MSQCPASLPLQLPYNSNDDSVHQKFYRRITSSENGARQHVKKSFPLWPVCNAPCFKRCADRNINSADGKTVGEACLAACAKSCGEATKCDGGNIMVNDKKVGEYTQNEFTGAAQLTGLEADIMQAYNASMKIGQNNRGERLKGSFDEMHTRAEESWVPVHDSATFTELSNKAKSLGELGRSSL